MRGDIRVDGQSPRLHTELGLFGAVMLGLGWVVGTGIFVSIRLGASIAGAGVLLALALASPVATANGLSSAQLAASYPVSGGTYEYKYKYLNRWWGFVADWMFLCVKSASAATAALGFAGYAFRPHGLQLSGILGTAGRDGCGAGAARRWYRLALSVQKAQPTGDVRLTAFDPASSVPQPGKSSHKYARKED